MKDGSFPCFYGNNRLAGMTEKEFQDRYLSAQWPVAQRPSTRPSAASCFRAAVATAGVVPVVDASPWYSARASARRPSRS